VLLGSPYKFAFIIERIPEWEINGWINGIMFVMINNDIYPKDVRTTTFNSEIPDILNPDSAFINPIIDKELYAKNNLQILKFVDNEENELFYRYFIPFHEIEDSGYRIYAISDGCNIKLLVCKKENGKRKIVDFSEISIQEYNEIKKQIISFYNNDKFSPCNNSKK